ncbi:MAG: DUF1259 domain-containing protein, partial [Gemmatimonadota bacterium]|nr:DUF1259 domain-containing protein [Gemmatimonadota bacterium]
MNGQLSSMILAGLLLASTACATARGAQSGAPTATSASEQASQMGGIDWKAVEAAMGRSGSMQDGGVFKFSMPRSDLSVTSQGVRIQPALSLGSWIAFKPRGENDAVVMGDLVLTEEEYNRVIARLQEGEIGQTAIHKHLLDEEPALWWTHVHAHGDPVAIARTVRAALALTGTPVQDPGASVSGEIGIDTAQIRQLLGHGGKVNGGVYQVSVPRPETIRAMGIEVPPAMGTATAINFQPTGGGRAAINGDFVMRANEVN